MIHLPDTLIDQLLLDDIQYGDLTSRALGLHTQQGTMTFTSKLGGCISGLDIAQRMLTKLGIHSECLFRDGDIVDPQSRLIHASGSVEALHQGWKAVQNVLEWCSGVSHYTHQMVTILKNIALMGSLLAHEKPFP